MSSSALDPGKNTKQSDPHPGDKAAQRIRAILAGWPKPPAPKQPEPDEEDPWR